MDDGWLTDSQELNESKICYVPRAPPNTPNSTLSTPETPTDRVCHIILPNNADRIKHAVDRLARGTKESCKKRGRLFNNTSPSVKRRYVATILGITPLNKTDAQNDAGNDEMSHDRKKMKESKIDENQSDDGKEIPLPNWMMGI